MGNNTEVSKQSVVIYWPNRRQYGSVLNSFSCKLIQKWPFGSWQNWGFGQFYPLTIEVMQIAQLLQLPSVSCQFLL